MTPIPRPYATKQLAVDGQEIEHRLRRLLLCQPSYRHARRNRLGLQAYALGIAYEFDPFFGLSISRVDPLPHQLEAVYEYLLKLARVRFLLADDAGAGKTMMSAEPAGAADEAEDGDEVASDGEDEAPRKRRKGLSLPFDVVRRFAQPLGIHLGDWEDRVIETEKGVVYLLPVGERAKQLFGEDGAQTVADRIEQSGERRPQLNNASKCGPAARSSSLAPPRGSQKRCAL